MFLREFPALLITLICAELCVDGDNKCLVCSRTLSTPQIGHLSGIIFLSCFELLKRSVWCTAAINAALLQLALVLAIPYIIIISLVRVYVNVIAMEQFMDFIELQLVPFRFEH